MPGTAKWYCAKCSRFLDNARTSCDTCGRIRGSARSRQGRRHEAGLFVIRVPQAKGMERGQPSSPSGPVPNGHAAPPR